jgi:hypothetical protein
MLHSTEELRGYTIHATDGEIGSVHSCYFDFKTWFIRYFVVKKDNWLRHRKVLLAPTALGSPNCETKHIPVALTTKQIMKGPSIDNHKPISHQIRRKLHKFDNWSPIWWRRALHPMSYAKEIAKLLDKNQYSEDEEDTKNENLSLRSTSEIIGYNIHTTDDGIGHLDDFVVDDQMWSIQYLVASIENHKVIISSLWVDNIDWLHNIVSVKLDRTSIITTPHYNFKLPID